MRNYARFGIECNQFQDYLADELTKRSDREGLYLPVERIINRGDKIGRIQKLQPLVKSGTIQFSRNSKTLLDQLRQFPKAAHDDGPDALEMAIEVAKRGGGGPLFWAVSTRPDGGVDVFTDEDFDDDDDDWDAGWIPIR